MKSRKEQLVEQIMDAADGQLSPEDISSLENDLNALGDPELNEMYEHMMAELPVKDSFAYIQPPPFAAQRLQSQIEHAGAAADPIILTFKRYILTPMIALLLVTVGLQLWYSESAGTDIEQLLSTDEAARSAELWIT